MNELARSGAAGPIGASEEAKDRQIGCQADARANVIPFAPSALARRRLETVARAGFSVVAQTHAMVVDLLAASDLVDLARRLRHLARTRLGLIVAVLAVESDDAPPLGWRRLAPGQADGILGVGRSVRMGRIPEAQGLFTHPSAEIAGAAVVRLQLWANRRVGVLAFASADEDDLAALASPDLIAFVARVIERCTDRWPP